MVPLLSAILEKHSGSEHGATVFLLSLDSRSLVLSILLLPYSNVS